MSYDLQPIKAPRMAGTALRFFAAAVESRWTRWALVGPLLASAGLVRYRKALVEEAPTPEPVFTNAPCGEEGSPPTLAAFATVARPRPSGFAFETAADLVAAYRDGRRSPEDVARRVLAAIAESEKGEPKLRALVAWNEPDLLAEARASAERYAAGRPLGPLDGVPIAVKDEIDQARYPTRVGTSFLGTVPATEDATAVARLRAAGALLIGKANMHEIGIGVTGLNPHHGTPRNPYAPGHFTGGSSSGPAAAVAAGLCPIAVGADGGGSIRIPAGLCGLVGLKATFGRVSEHGAAPVCWSVAHIGPIAASAVDAALAYAIMAGPDPHDGHTLGQPTPHLDGFDSDDLTGLRIGVYRPWYGDASPEVVGACDAMLRALTERGARVVDIEIPHLELYRVAHIVTIVSEMASALEPHYAEHRTHHGLDVRINLAIARQLTSLDYVKAQRARTRLLGHMAKVMDAVDVIALPTTGTTSPPIPPDALPDGESDLPKLSGIMRFASLANFCGYPAISVPAGYDGNGLPIGFQAIGRPWAEHTLLRLARIAERSVERRGPRIHYRLLD